MKKVISLIIVFLACIVAACAVCLAGCSSVSESDSYVHLLDLSKYEVGDELPVCPDCKFDYAVNEDCLIHIESMTATLLEKNTVTDESVLQGRYSPYTINVNVKGSADLSYSGTQIYVSVLCPPTEGAYAVGAIIDGDGRFSCEIDINVHNLIGVYFYYISLG